MDEFNLNYNRYMAVGGSNPSRSTFVPLAYSDRAVDS